MYSFTQFIQRPRLGRALMAMVFVASLVGCASDRDRGSAAVSVKTLGLSQADVSRVEVTITGADIGMPITQELTKRADDWYGIVGAIPQGSGRIFAARAFDASDALIYQGEASGVVITAGVRAQVLIVLQQVTPPDPFVNHAPRIDSLVASAQQVAPSATVDLALTAHDPDVADVLSYSWSASAGTFAAPTAADTAWTAPASEGPVTLTCVVSDNKGASVSVSLTIDVRAAYGTGEAEVIATLNTWPVASGLVASPAQVDAGGSIALDLTAADADGDALAFAWTDGGGDCAGSFSDANAEDPQWVAPVLAPASGICTLEATITDGRGGQTTAQIVVRVGDLPTANVAPVVTATFQSALTVGPSDVVAFRISATDPEGAAVSFAWSTSTGSLGTPVDTTDSSEVSWTAPTTGTSCQITVVVSDGVGGNTTHVFSVQGPVVAHGYTPGTTLVVPNVNTRVSDVYRSPTGALLVASCGGSYVGGITVTRSDDGGITWQRTDLGNGGSNHMYNARLFPVDGNTIAVAGTQGTTLPYDGFIQYSTNDGVSYNGYGST